MTRSLSLPTAILILALASPVAAEIRPELQLEITVPDSVYVAGDIAVRDVNGDGYSELLLLNANPIVAYSLKNDKAVDFFRHASDGLQRRYKADYIDGDGRLDIAEAVMIPGGSGDTFALVCHYGIDSYALPDTIYATGGLDTSRTYTIDRLYFADSDRDGRKELYSRFYYTVVVWDDPWAYEPSTYYTYYPVSYSFEDQTASTSVSFPPDITPFYYANDSAEAIATLSAVTGYSHIPRYHGRGETNSWFFHIYIELNDGNPISRCFQYGVSCDYEWNSGNDYRHEASLVAKAAGDILPDRPGPELLLLIDYVFGAMGYWGGCWAEARQLVIFNLNDPANWDTVLNVLPYEGVDIDQLFVDERFDGYFLSLDSGLIRMHDAQTFEVVDYSGVRLAGSWVGYVKLRDDEPALAVFRDGRTFRFYSLSFLPINAEDDDILLPNNFDLGRPYPNPFNPTVTIPVTVDRKGLLRVEVFNPLGQRVTVLHDAVVSPGELVLSWDASDFGSGIYLIKASLGEETKTVKAVLVK